MKNEQSLNRKTQMTILTGILLMTAFTATKIHPSSTLAQYSVFIGIAFFFITEAVSKTKRADSGLRFQGLLSEITKPGVLLWMLLPVISGILTLAAGSILFGDAFVGHLLSRTGSIISFNQSALLVLQLVLGAFGEEIAYRGFFFGKGKQLMPVWLCAVFSSVCFAMGHLTTGAPGLVFFDVATVFIDSMLFWVVYQKTGNCVVSTLSHFLANFVSILLVILFF